MQVDAIHWLTVIAPYLGQGYHSVSEQWTLKDKPQQVSLDTLSFYVGPDNALFKAGSKFSIDRSKRTNTFWVKHGHLTVAMLHISLCGNIYSVTTNMVTTEYIKEVGRDTERLVASDGSVLYTRTVHKQGLRITIGKNYITLTKTK